MVEVNIGEEKERLLNYSTALLANIECPNEEIAKLASRGVVYLILVS
jgi:hypothetical protein